jgi:hypothetical protein
VAGLFSLIGLALATRLLSVRPSQIARAVWPCLVPTAGMAGVLLALDAAIGPEWLVVVAGGIAGAATYLGLVALIAPASLHYIRHRLAGRATPGAA